MNLSSLQVMYTPDNKQLLSCSDDKTVRMWDTATGGEVTTRYTARCTLHAARCTLHQL